MRRLVSRLHNILRDTDGDSSLIERFDELAKLTFIWLYDYRNTGPSFVRADDESPKALAQRIRSRYRELAKQLFANYSERYQTIRCSDATIQEAERLFAAAAPDTHLAHIKGVAYEEVVRGTFDKSDHQQFFTPHQIVAFVLSMVGGVDAKTVMDPAAGTGGFLAGRQSSNPKERIIGVEIDERLAWATTMNLLLHGKPNHVVHLLPGHGSLGNGLQEHIGKVDLIVTNPPFGSEVSDSTVLNTFALGHDRPSRRRGILFLERCIALLREGGTLAIVIDEGVLNLPSTIDVRRFLLEACNIEAIVSLPETAFMPYASVNTSILVLKKTSKPHNSRVFFAKADEVGRRNNGDEDIDFALDGTRRLRSDLPANLDVFHRVRNKAPTHHQGFVVSTISRSLTYMQ